EAACRAVDAGKIDGNHSARCDRGLKCALDNSRVAAPRELNRSPQPAMPLIALGLNHQTAPLALRERVAFDAAALPAALAALRAQPGVEEVALVSTCNRTEIYAGVEPGAEDVPARWLAKAQGLETEALAAYSYRHEY